MFEADGTEGKGRAETDLDACYPCRRTPARDHGELQIAEVRDHVALLLFDDFENFSVFRPRPLHEKSLAAMQHQLVAWGGALRGLRSVAADADQW